jgi:hypothetical protein
VKAAIALQHGDDAMVQQRKRSGNAAVTLLTSSAPLLEGELVAALTRFRNTIDCAVLTFRMRSRLVRMRAGVTSAMRSCPASFTWQTRTLPLAPK